MRELKLAIDIDGSVTQVFDFTLNPKNTPKWIDSIVTEETSEWPPKLGTIYRNRGKDGQWTEYEMTDFQKNKMFVLSKRGGNYHVKYTFKSIDNGSTQFEYHEWVDQKELEEPFSLVTLQKLKNVIEAQNG